MISRVLEVEAMDDPQEAAEYDAMDHAAVNRAFVDDMLAGRPIAGEVLDLGTGTAQIPIELARRNPAVHVTAVDLSSAMLQVAARNVAAAGLASRIVLERIDAKRLPFPDGRFACVVSNSIVHHLPAPLGVLREAVRVAAPGGLLFFRDLLRPETVEDLARLVDLYAGGANDHQRKMLADSLHAALAVEEMQELVGQIDLPVDSQVRATSDRHWTWSGRKGTNG